MNVPKQFFETSGCESPDYAPTFSDDYADSLRKRCPKKRSSPRVLSLFAGAGGLDIGFSDAGFSIVDKVEIESVFCETLRANSCKDGQFSSQATVTNLDIREYKPNLKKVDFIVGGPPCQSFSAAGARANGVAGTRDERGNLFQEYVRILGTLQPKGFLFENVYRIVGANGGKDWPKVIAAFSKAGYTLRYRILDAADYGVPQHRERLIIVGIRNDIASSHEFKFPRPTHGPDSPTGASFFTAGNALLDQTSTDGVGSLGGMYGDLLPKIPPGLNYSFFTEKMGHPNPIFAWRSKFSDFLYKADPCRPVRTLKAQGGKYTGPFHWSNRPFTIAELKRLQTFPDRYQLTGSRSDQVKQLGNSVPPQLARVLAESVYCQLFNKKHAHSIPLLLPDEELGFRKRKRVLTSYYQSAATKAISKLNRRAKTQLTTQEYHCEFTSSLKWDVESDVDEFRVVESTKNSELRIKCIPVKAQAKIRRNTIHVHPVGQWILPFDKVVLVAGSVDAKSIAACWKAFEYFLSRNDIKADLVQLAGYYQYECSFSCRYVSKVTDNFYRFLKAVTEGKFLNKNLTSDELSKLLEVSEEEVLCFLERLKEVGFEIRSSKTNASIDNGCFLIPYCFPTLNERSVQRSKALV